MSPDRGENKPPERIFDALGTLRKGHIQPLGNHDFSGWYKSWDRKARPWFLRDDFEQLTEELDRVLYSTINYQDIRLLDTNEFEWGENGRVWKNDEQPTPGYEDLSAIAPFADIDLDDDHKQRPLNGDLQIAVEEAIGEYVEHFSSLTGSSEPVFALDSVGGAYVFISPAVTLPIADAFNGEDKGWIFDELTDRMNDKLAEFRDLVNDEVPAVEGVFEPDQLNNVNRLYKAPLSRHSSIEGVVHPIDEANPSYDFVPSEGVDDALEERTEQWAEDFTDTSLSNYCDELVSSLWSEYDGDWEDRLTQWVEDKQEEEAQKEAQREAARERIENRVVDLSDVEYTDDQQTIADAVEAIDVREVARDVATAYDTDPGRDPPRFEPAYRPSSTGTSCFVTRDKYVDLEEGQSGGGAAKLVARHAGIISHSSETLSGTEWGRAVDRLRQMGYSIPQYREGFDESGLERAYEAVDNAGTISFDTADDVDFSEISLLDFTLAKPPRAGGSFIIMEYFSKMGEKNLYIAPRHSILRSHLETVDDHHMEADWTAVHVKGSAQVCETSGSCHKIPSGPDEYQEAIEQIREIVYCNTAVTEEDCPEELCKSWFLKKAAEYADIVLTVPELIDNVGIEWGEHDSRLMIDEEQSIDSFRPSSIGLIDIGMVSEPDGSEMPAITAAPILQQVYALQEIKENIKEDQEERKEQAKEAGRDWRATAIENDLLEAIEFFNDILDALGVTEAKRRLMESEDEVTLDNTIEEIEENLESLDFPDPTTADQKLYEKIGEYTAPLSWNDDADPKAVFEAIFWKFEDNPWLVRKGYKEQSIMLVGGRDVIFHEETLKEFTQIGIIAGPEGPRFLNDLGRKNKTIFIDDFKYADDFVVVPVGQQFEKDDGSMAWESRRQQRRRVKRVARGLNRRRVPHIAVAGTKDQARNLHGQMGQGDADIISNPESPAMVLHNRHRIGGTAIIYENSIVTRGIDSPYYDVTVVTSSGFKTPYWEAVIDLYDDAEKDSEEEDRYLEAKSVRNERKARELTNAAFRMSQTYDTEHQYGTKFIVVSRNDAERLKYVQHRRTPVVGEVDDVASLIENLVARGDVELGQNDFYHGVGGGEKTYIELAGDETVQPMEQDRPSYTLDEIETWIDKEMLMDREKAISVYNFIDQYPGKPTTTEVKEKMPSSNDGSVNNILDVLHRKGVLSLEKDSDGRGRPSKRWSVNLSMSE